MPDPSVIGKVGHKLLAAASAGNNAAAVDTTPQFALGEKAFYTNAIGGGDVYVAVYVIAGQTISGSATIAINASGTASVSAGGFFAMFSAGAAALPGEYLWVRSSAVVA